MAYTLTRVEVNLHRGTSPTGALIELRKPRRPYRDARGYWNLLVDGEHLNAFRTLSEANTYLARMYGERLGS